MGTLSAFLNRWTFSKSSSWNEHCIVVIMIHWLIEMPCDDVKRLKTRKQDCKGRLTYPHSLPFGSWIQALLWACMHSAWIAKCWDSSLRKWTPWGRGELGFSQGFKGAKCPQSANQGGDEALPVLELYILWQRWIFYCKHALHTFSVSFHFWRQLFNSWTCTEKR